MDRLLTNLTINPLFDAAMRVLRPNVPNVQEKEKALDMKKITEESILYLPRSLYLQVKTVGKVKGQFSIKEGYPMISVPTAYGCPYRCIYCGFSEARLQLSSNKSLQIAKAAVDKVILSGAKYFHVMWLSGIMDTYMPLIYMQRLLEYIRHKYSKQVVEVETEARPDQLLDIDIIKKLKKSLGKKIKLVIGIGVETFDDKLMSGLLNRGTNKYRIIKAIKNLKLNNIGCTAHVLSHLPLLTEIESIKNAVNTIKDLFSLNTSPDKIILMALNLQPNTLLWLMEKDGYYKHPSIWGYFEIIKKIPKEYLSKIGIGGFTTGGGCPPLRYLEAETKQVTSDAYSVLIKMERSNYDMRIIDALLKKYNEQYSAWKTQQMKIERTKESLIARLINICHWVAQHKVFKSSLAVGMAAKEFLPKIEKAYQGIGRYVEN